MPRPKGIIIGAGISGLAAAIALNQSGIPVEIYEQVEQIGEVGAGILLWANAVRVLDRLGLGGIIRGQGIPQIQGSIRTPDGTVLASLSDIEMERKYGVPSIVLHRAELQKILIEGIGSTPIHLGKALQKFEQDSSGVTAFFTDGSQAHADFLVGADGLYSTVRVQIHGPHKPAYAGYTAWRGIVTFEPDLLTPGETWGAGARFGQVLMSGGRVYWFATHNTSPGKRAARGEQSELMRIFSTWHAPIPDLIEATVEAAILRNDIYDRPVINWWGMGRVTLAGDAAHPMTPNLGQGACQGLEDALVLARKLHDSPQVIGGLRAYEAERISRVNPIVKLSRQFGWVAQWQNPLALQIRQVLVREVFSRMQDRQLDQVIGINIPA